MNFEEINFEDFEDVDFESEYNDDFEFTEEGEKVVLAQMLAGKFERPWVEQAMEKLKVDVKPR